MYPRFASMLAASAQPHVVVGPPVGGWIYGANGTYKPAAATSGIPSGTSLVTHSGSYTITTSGTTITGMNITGGIDIKTSNVTISACRVRAPAPSAGSACVDCRWSGCVNALVTDCEIAPDTAYLGTGVNCAMGRGVTWQRCNMHAGTDGVRSSTNTHDAGNTGTAANAYLLGNYIHGLAGWLNDPSQGGPSHSDTWQPEGGNNNVGIGNNFQGFIDGTLGGGTATAANWNGGNHYGAGWMTTNSCLQYNHNTASQTSGCMLNNNWLDGGYIAVNVSLGAGQRIDSMNNNKFGHGTTSGLQLNLSGTTIGSRTGDVFEDGVGSITVHA